MLVLLVAACGLSLVFAGSALAGNGNGNGCEAPGHAYGHDNCEAPADPPPPPPAPPPPPPPSGGDPALPSSDPGQSSDPPAGDSGAPSSDGAPAGDTVPSGGSGDSTDAPASPTDDSTGGAPNSSARDSGSGPDSLSPPDSPPPPPPASSDWAPLVARPNTPAPKPTPRPTAPRGRTFASAPAASRGEPDASSGDSQNQAARPYGLVGTSAAVTLRHGHGVQGGLSFRVAMMRGASTFAFRAERSVVADAGGRLYRIGAWLRSDAPGLTVCPRIQEMTAKDSLTPVRTSESCLAPTAKWKHFRLYRRTLARGNRLVFSIYSYGVAEGDSFEIDKFVVSRRVKLGWKRVDAAFGDGSASN